MGTIAALPDAALHHLFACVCDICPPTSPGICHLSLVCTRWRAIAGGVTGLRVLFQKRELQPAAAFCAWVARHAPQINTLGLAEAVLARRILCSLMDAAQAAAGSGKPLPLSRLVIFRSWSLGAYECRHTLAPLLAALPSLEGLTLDLVAEACCVTTPGLLGDGQGQDDPDAAVLAAVAPLRHSTALTDLELSVDTQRASVLAALPSSLRSLSWTNLHLVQLDPMSFDHLVNLEELWLTVAAEDEAARLPVNPLTSLQQLQTLRVLDFPWPVGSAAQHAAQLVCWRPDPHEADNQRQLLADLEQLTNLRGFDAEALTPGEVVPVLATATQLTQLYLHFHGGDAGDEAAAVDAPRRVLEQALGQLPGLQLLLLRVDKEYGTSMAPQLQFFTALRELTLELEAPSPEWAAPLTALVNLELLGIPLQLAAVPTPWLTALTKLLVLELAVGLDTQQGDLTAAAAQVGQLVLATAAAGGGQGDGDSMSGSGVDAGGGAVEASTGLQVVCLHEEFSGSIMVAGGQQPLQQLQGLLQGVVPAASMPHFFQGTANDLLNFGAEMWPQPLARRLQQLPC
jgi:hypothetical protein